VSEEIVIKIVDLFDARYCCLAGDGEKVYNAIAQILRDGNKVCLCFDGVDIMTSAFLNSAIGRLYDGKFDYDMLNKNIRAVDIDQYNLSIIKRIVENAKRFYSEPNLTLPVIDEMAKENKEDKKRSKDDDKTYVVDANQLDMFTGGVIGKRVERKIHE